MSASTPPDEWTNEKRDRMHDLELEPHTLWPASLLKQRALKERVDRGEFRDDMSRDMPEPWVEGG